MCALWGHTCNCSTDVFKSRNCGLNAWKWWRTLHRTSCSKWHKKNRKINIVEFDNVEMFLCSFYIETTTRKIHKMHKTQHISLRFTILRIPVSTFRNVYVNVADHETKYEINRELRMAARIMTWFLWGITLGIGQSRLQWKFWTRLSKHGLPISPLVMKVIVVSAVILTTVSW